MGLVRIAKLGVAHVDGYRQTRNGCLWAQVDVEDGAAEYMTSAGSIQQRPVTPSALSEAMRLLC